MAATPRHAAWQNARSAPMPASPPLPARTAKRDPRPPITVSAEDYDALAALVAHPSAAPGHALLAVELERAAVVEGAPAANRVRLGSEVDYHDLDRDRLRTIRLSLPREASIDERRVSVTAPIGAALLGLKPRQRFTWTEPGGRTRSILVLAVRNDA
ncbi:hypothetical protein DDF67_20130 [Caulobacter endophyticus]|uniref:Regulator of nucleoside diphosphate kinase n=2 Tax=Caulobacter endophyticus TaxID=2172652 RepID=A0A2T9JJC1_9CAUL|nr:hypothetical protein DDF67_20130 [Caulobacter endophyticus]